MASEDKVHLNLSEQAFYILISDSWSFSSKGFDTKKTRPGDGIINHIFCNFCKKSLANRLFSRPEAGLHDGELKTYFYANDKDPKLQFSISLSGKTNDLLSTFMRLKEKDAEKKADKKKKDQELERKKAENLSAFEPEVAKLYAWAPYVEEVDLEEIKYRLLMPNRGKFIKAVLEEYAALPYYRREEIYFENIREEVFKREQADTVPLVSFLHQNGERMSFYPYQFLRDEWSSHNYVIGMDENRKICNYRISKLQKIISSDEGKGRVFTREECAELKNAITQKGVMFVADEVASVRLALTEAGMNLYRTMTFMRPKYKGIARDEKGRYILEFVCAPRQIEFYFFKFGEGVEILGPEGLRDRFREKYQLAYHNHCVSQEEP